MKSMVLASLFSRLLTNLVIKVIALLSKVSPMRFFLLRQYSRISLVKSFQELHQNVKAHQSNVDRFSDEGQLLAQTTSEGRVSTYVQQMSTRYQALLNSSKVK